MERQIEPNREYAFIGNDNSGKLNLIPYYKLGKDFTEEEIKAFHRNLNVNTWTSTKK